ncbi:MAG: hypothetical protein ACOYNZ_13765 [Rhodoferax sp.]
MLSLLLRTTSTPSQPAGRSSGAASLLDEAGQDGLPSFCEVLSRSLTAPVETPAAALASEASPLAAKPTEEDKTAAPLDLAGLAAITPPVLALPAALPMLIAQQQMTQQRRGEIQSLFAANQDNPPALLQALTRLGVSAAELSDASDTRPNAVNGPRRNEVSDVLAGLKASSAAEVKSFHAGKTATHPRAAAMAPATAPSSPLAQATPTGVFAAVNPVVGPAGAEPLATTAAAVAAPLAATAAAPALAAQQQTAPQRRSEIQALFAANQHNPPAMMQAMTRLGISAAELSGAMDHKLNTDDWLRLNGAADGFAGLKVFSAAEVKDFIDFQNAGSGSYQIGQNGHSNLGKSVSNPRDVAIAQQTMEREQRRAALGTGYVPEYLGGWRASTLAAVPSVPAVVRARQPGSADCNTIGPDGASHPDRRLCRRQCDGRPGQQ